MLKLGTPKFIIQHDKTQIEEPKFDATSKPPAA